MIHKKSFSNDVLAEAFAEEMMEDGYFVIQDHEEMSVSWMSSDELYDTLEYSLAEVLTEYPEKVIALMRQTKEGKAHHLNKIPNGAIEDMLARTACTLR